MIMSRIFIPLMLALPLTASSQHVVLANPSFEGIPADATVPQGWLPCERGTTPDILPGYWGVYLEASEGESFVGLITRETGTWESIGQRMSSILRKGGCYSMSVDLAHSITYSGYSGPIRLRVWIGSNKCSKHQLVFESPLIEHTQWKTYPFTFRPKSDARYILLEAFHQDPPFSYKGNILIDRLSAIKGCDKT